MLLYTHAFDGQHTQYRLLLLFNKIDTPLNLEQIRIFDFMIAFPSYLTKIRKTKNIKIRAGMNKYDFFGSYQQCFFLMEPVQVSSLLQLVVKKIIYKNGNAFGRNNFFSSLYNGIDEIDITSEQKEAICIITEMLSGIKVFGKDGLKDRTFLLESVYDPEP